MKGLGYLLIIFLLIGCWVIWEIVRRASAGAQAIVNPERYAIHKLVQMQSDAAISKNDLPDRWTALVKYDNELAAAAEQLRPFGDKWVVKLGRDYFTLNEDKQYLPNMVRTLVGEARREAAEEEEERHRRARTLQLYDGSTCTESSRRILRTAEAHGYIVRVDPVTRTIEAEKNGIFYLRSNSDIQDFAQVLNLVHRPTTIPPEGKREYSDPLYRGQWKGVPWWEYSDGKIVATIDGANKEFANYNDFESFCLRFG